MIPSVCSTQRVLQNNNGLISVSFAKITVYVHLHDVGEIRKPNSTRQPNEWKPKQNSYRFICESNEIQVIILDTPGSTFERQNNYLLGALIPQLLFILSPRCYSNFIPLSLTPNKKANIKVHLLPLPLLAISTSATAKTI